MEDKYSQDDLVKMLLKIRFIVLRDFETLNLVFEAYNKDESNEKKIKRGWRTYDLTNFNSWKTKPDNFYFVFEIDEEKLNENLLDKALQCGVSIDKSKFYNRGKERFTLNFLTSLDFLPHIENEIKEKFGWYLEDEYKKNQKLLIKDEKRNWIKRKEKEILNFNTEKLNENK